MTDLGQEFWEDMHRRRAGHAMRQSNPHLVAETEGLKPGLALDAGCGAGAEAVWLAQQGWQVVAADFSETALGRAREHAAQQGAEVAGRIEWMQADLTVWAPEAERFDLVCSHYVHPAGPKEALFERLAAAVAPGGTLLVVGHQPPEPGTVGTHGEAPELYFSADDVAACLDVERWKVEVCEVRSRPGTGHEGHEVMLSDAVLRARKVR